MPINSDEVRSFGLAQVAVSDGWSDLAPIAVEMLVTGFVVEAGEALQWEAQSRANASSREDQR